jgi:hypothetical protein
VSDIDIVRRERVTRDKLVRLDDSELVALVHEMEDQVERLTVALAEDQAASLQQAEIARDALTQVERLTGDNQALAHALRLAIAGRPVRNADELLSRAALPGEGTIVADPGASGGAA